MTCGGPAAPVVCAVAVLASACSNTTPSSRPCRPAELRRGPVEEYAHNVVIPAGPPWLVTNGSAFVAVLYGDPLIGGKRSDGKANKVLWIAVGEEPRDPSDLVIHATGPGNRRVAQASPSATSNVRQFPSFLDVPSSGCWVVTLTLGSLKDTTAIEFG